MIVFIAMNKTKDNRVTYKVYLFNLSLVTLNNYSNVSLHSSYTGKLSVLSFCLVI